MSEAAASDSEKPAEKRRVVLVTGPSGAGRSTALNVLEDAGFEAIDNLPLRLLPQLIEGGEPGRALALGIDARTRDFSTDRVLGRDFAGGKHYASANHWPRAWYDNALENPRVQVTMDGTTADYIAVPVDDEEHERVAAEIGNGIGFKIMVGFAPQRFLRLDPVESR